ncbi:hypothetical protein EW146_g9020 [Bondarzewia mesenterica]|uniref:ubiquitinyl hydrolase 1 n=1 Tax=Bondarzewia mesenterica TaxID=1095465 RepID=A0A4V3XD49_9AGAM|nr:hypothetical protein EW146_g9020 [Bondarzewia mesenterica]
MAISKAAKWISFAVPAASPQPSAPALVKRTPVVPSLSRADAKQFGLENFGNTWYVFSSSLPARILIVSPATPTLSSRPFTSARLSATSSSNLPISPPRQSQSYLLYRPPVIPPSSLVSNRHERAKVSSDHIVPPASPAFTIPPAPPTLFSALRSLYVHISKNPHDRGTIAPRAFIDKLKEVNELFRSSMHQDAHEFLNYLLNKIAEEVEGDKNHREVEASGEDVATLSSGVPTTMHSTSSQHEHALVHRLFEGILTSETRCLTCETVSSRDESFLDLSIDIEQNSSVTACLRQFSASEMLCQKNKFFCDSCCGLQEAEKRMKIKKLPNILALHLKRFKYQEDVQKYIKLAYRVAFPLELRLFNTVDDAEDPDRLYELFAIVVHIGNGPHHGHYIAIVKAPSGWLIFDDDKIDSIKESDIPKYFGDSPSGSAYVLYYQAVDLDPISLGLKQNTSRPELPAVAIIDPPTAVDSADQGPAMPPGLGDETVEDADAEQSDTSHSSPTPPSAGASSKTSLPALRVTTPSTAADHHHHPASPMSANGRSGGLLHGLRASTEERALVIFCEWGC